MNTTPRHGIQVFLGPIGRGFSGPPGRGQVDAKPGYNRTLATIVTGLQVT